VLLLTHQVLLLPHRLLLLPHLLQPHVLLPHLLLPHLLLPHLLLPHLLLPHLLLPHQLLLPHLLRLLLLLLRVLGLGLVLVLLLGIECRWTLHCILHVRLLCKGLLLSGNWCRSVCRLRQDGRCWFCPLRCFWVGLIWPARGQASRVLHALCLHLQELPLYLLMLCLGLCE
jgi:hypothetical protein